MTTSKSSKPASQEVLDLLADLDAEFGKKKDNGAKALNKKFHEQNPRLAPGAAAARPDPEDSSAWHPIACITHVVRQRCRTCGNTSEHIGGEFVKFRSTQRFGGEILRRAENCPDIFLRAQAEITAFGNTIQRMLPDLIEEHEQTVARCPGCIAVERIAEELWEKATHAKPQLDLELNSQVSEIQGYRPFETEWPEAFSKPTTTCSIGR